MTAQQKAALVKLFLNANSLLRAKKEKTRKEYAEKMAEAVAEFTGPSVLLIAQSGLAANSRWKNEWEEHRALDETEKDYKRELREEKRIRKKAP